MAEPLPEIPTGIAPVVTNPLDNSLAELSGMGIPITDITGTWNRDGGTTNPIVLRALSQLTAGLGFPLLIIQNTAGRILALPAQGDNVQRFLGSKNGSWQAVPLEPLACFDYDAICACPADFIAGWQIQEDGSICLVKLNPSDVGGSDHFTNTNTTTVTGTGTSGSPIGINVKISAVSGNRIQILSDGLYVGPDY